MDIIKEMLATGGKRRFVPNVKVIYREFIYVPPYINRTFANPLYGAADRAAMELDDLDERAYERTILRFSPYFRRMRKIRSDVSASAPYILGETKVNDIPDYRNFEYICDGMLECSNYNGKARKWLCVPERGVFEFFGDGTVKMMYTNYLIPDIFLANGQQTCSAYSVSFEETQDADGILGGSRRFVTENLAENLTEKGGSFSFSYSATAGGVCIEQVSISARVYPVPGK